MLEQHLVRNDFRDRVEQNFSGRPLSQGVKSRRAQSYDHCYNYFVDTEDLEFDMEKSCAVLGFYLASWGMYRGSSYLLRRTNSSDLRDVVRLVTREREALSAIDVDDYTDDSIRAILEVYGDIKRELLPGNERSITLVTKVMAAVFGCVPAFDTYFVKGLRAVLSGNDKLPSERLTSKSLQLVAAFYRANRTDIDRLHGESRTVAFGGDAVTEHNLTRAKIIDMYCFDLGS
jgi:hypothetical protein